MGQYTNKGLYNSYDKNHKERDKTDYYATPTAEVENILKELNIDFSNQSILEPCAGGGHMLKGICNYICGKACENVSLTGTDYHKHKNISGFDIETGDKYDFLSDDYPYGKYDWIIMNPPYATIEPFTIRAMEIAQKGIIMLARLQFLEGAKRYESILKETPPTDVYVYIDRIQCWKGGEKPDGSSAQAYAWFVWNYDKEDRNTEVHWIHRAE